MAWSIVGVVNSETLNVRFDFQSTAFYRNALECLGVRSLDNRGLHKSALVAHETTEESS